MSWDGKERRSSDMILGELLQIAKNHDDRFDKLETMITAQDKRLDDMDALKNKGWGVLVGLSLVASGVGAWLSAAAHKMFS